MHCEVLLQEIMIYHFMSRGMKSRTTKGDFTESVLRWVHHFHVHYNCSNQSHSVSRPQKPAEIRDILTNDRAKAAGIVYLEDESYKFHTKEGGREWSVYGSPVRVFSVFLRLAAPFIWSYVVFNSGNHISATGHSITGLGRKLKVSHLQSLLFFDTYHATPQPE
jgi:hypothetical protein